MLESVSQFLQSLTAFVLWGSFVWFWAIALIVFICFFVAESKDTGAIALISIILFLGANYFWGNFPFKEVFTWRNVGIYLFIGFVFSLIKTYFAGRKLAKAYGADKYLSSNIEYEKSKLKGRVFRWWFIWWASFLHWVFSDLLSQFWDAIYQKVGKIFENLFTAGINSQLPPKKDEPRELLKD